jgi:hypothetical protein
VYIAFLYVKEAVENSQRRASSTLFVWQPSRSFKARLLLLLSTVCAAGEECRLPDFPCTMFSCNPAAALNGPILTVAAITAAAHGAAAAAAAAAGSQQSRHSRGGVTAAAGVQQGPLQLVSCPRMCLQRRPLMVNASFSDDGTRIQVSF